MKNKRFENLPLHQKIIFYIQFAPLHRVWMVLVFLVLFICFIIFFDYYKNLSLFMDHEIVINDNLPEIKAIIAPIKKLKVIQEPLLSNKELVIKRLESKILFDPLDLESFSSLSKLIVEPDRKYETGLYTNLSLQIGMQFYQQVSKSKNAYISGILPKINRSTSQIAEILLYHPFYLTGPANWNFGFGRKPFIKSKCRINECSITSNLMALKTADVVVFFAPSFPSYLKIRERFPKVKRPLYQKWIIHIMESNYYGWLKSEEYANYFNATMTFKRNSDIYTPYGHYETILSDETNYDENRNYATGKSKIVAWFVTHCDTQSQRMYYGWELRKHLKVDIYGKCGNLRCEGKTNCENMLEKDYKFYLSFENSLCADYVTEKVWNILQLSVIPVVLGNNAYDEILPPKSFIDVRNFKSPEKLAEYLTYLNKNDSEFNEYFKWKAKYKAFNDFGLYDNNRVVMCNLCEYIHTQRNRTKIYVNPKLFWNVDDQCMNPKQFYKGIAETIVARF